LAREALNLRGVIKKMNLPDYLLEKSMWKKPMLRIIRSSEVNILTAITLKAKDDCTPFGYLASSAFILNGLEDGYIL
jgi:hypothetical protein